MKSGIECFDVTKEYYEHAIPGQGIVQHEAGTDENDRKVSELLFRIFGGNIKTLQVENRNGQDLKTPDALWNGMYWEYKRVSSKRSVEDRIRSGWHQLKENAERKGMQEMPIGFVIDISNRTESREDTIRYIEIFLGNIVENAADLIIKDNEEIVKIIRKKRG